MTISSPKAEQLLDNVSTAVLVFGTDLRLRFINTAGEHLLSVSRRMVQGLTARELLSASEDFTGVLERTIACKQPYTQWGVKLALHNNELITVGSILTPIMGEEKCSEVIVEFVDAHSLTRVMREENVAALHDAASKSLRGMAHEIKNPLGGLRGAAQLLERELGNRDLTEYTRIIISEADRLRGLIDRMLGPSGEARRSQINIHEILEYVRELVRVETDGGLTITRDYDPSLPDAVGYREHLIQVFLNIVRNAVEAVENVDAPHIRMRTRVNRMCTIRQKQYKLVACIEIMDNGPGIPADIESEIFYPLITGRADGTGLGLSIAQSLMQKHGGSVDYERCGDKTVFRILLPLSRADG